MNNSDAIDIGHAAELICDAKEILVLSGAGISAESGIPTFREAQTGLWAKYSPEDLATPEGFAANPERVWAWYQWRRALIARGGANTGHRAIAELERKRTVFVATQNVDGLHSAAGSTTVAELHGNIWRDRCSACQTTVTHEVAEPIDNKPHYCHVCGEMTRPDVVWFGEALPRHEFLASGAARERAGAVLVVGTSNQVYPAATLVDKAIRSTAPVIEINPQRTDISDAVDVKLAMSASRALPELISALDC